MFMVTQSAQTSTRLIVKVLNGSPDCCHCELDTGAPSCGLQRLSSPLLPPLLPASHIKTALLVQFKTPLQEEETLLPFISEGNKKSD